MALPASSAACVGKAQSINAASEAKEAAVLDIEFSEGAVNKTAAGSCDPAAATDNHIKA
jgi:hypothetical protein